MTRLLQDPLCLGLSTLALNAAFSYIVIRYEYHHFHAEDGLLENLQSLLLVLAALVFLWLPRPSIAVGASQLGLALLCFTFVLRELNVEELPLPQLLITLGSGGGKRFLLGLLWLALGLWLALHYRRDPDLLTQMLRLPIVRPLLLAFPLLLLSLAMDKNLLELDHARLLEELAELNAYLLLLLIALRPYRSSQALPAKTRAA